MLSLINVKIWNNQLYLMRRVNKKLTKNRKYYPVFLCFYTYFYILQGNNPLKNQKYKQGIENTT